jgi:hypothetical protein
MLGLNKKSVSIILGMMLALGVVTLAYAADPPTWFSFTPTRTWTDGAIPDVDDYDGCYGANSTGNNGWDIDMVGLRYFPITDTLYVGISMWNEKIAGDIDGDGNPSGGASCFTAGGWVDDPNLGEGAEPEFGEAIDFIINNMETDGDTTYEYIAGVSHSTYIGDPSGGFAVVNYDTTTNPYACPPGETPLTSPGDCYGMTSWGPGGEVKNNPGMDGGGPDFEFTINNFSVMLDHTVSLNPLNFSFFVRTGKMLDGTGEDSMEATGVPTAVTLSSFAGRSSAGGSASGLWLGVAGLTVLAAGSLFRAKRRAH